MDLPDNEFERLVAEALELIPAEFLAYLENVRIVIEEEPGKELLKQLHVRRDVVRDEDDRRIGRWRQEACHAIRVGP